MPPFDPWDVTQIEAQAPDEASVTAARKVLRKGGFERIESRADGTGWWAVCRGLTDVYNVTATRGPTGTVRSDCTCPSPKRPCKHALALLLHLAVHPKLRPELTAAPVVQADHLEGLIAAVFAAPDDDLPRLVLADYLEERGEAERAALIRVSCELDKGKMPAARKKVLQKEVARLSEAVLAEPLALLPRGTTHKLRRGLLWLTGRSLAFGAAGAMPESLLRLFKNGCVELLALSGFFGEVMTLARYVRRLDLTDGYLPDEVLVALATDLRPGSDGVRLKEVVLPRGQQRRYKELLAGGGPPLTRLHDPTPARIRALAAEGRFRKPVPLTVVGGGDDALVALADVSDLRTLGVLHLENTAATAVGLIALGNSRHLRGLSRVRVNGGRLTDTDLESIGRDAKFPGLDQLLLNRLHITDAGLDALARGPAFARLERLALNDVPVTTTGLRRLLTTHDSLHTLEVGGVVPAAELLALVAARTDRPIRIVTGGTEAGWSGPNAGLLTAGGLDGLPAGFFTALAKWPKGWRVEHLSIEGSSFEEGAFAELLHFVALGRIPRLTVSHCRLRNADAAALAARLPELGVTHLDLSGNKFGMTGAKALAVSPGLAKLAHLDLAGNPLRQSGRAALAASPHKAALTEVNLGGERVDTTEAKELRKAFGKGVKVVVRA